MKRTMQLTGIRLPDSAIKSSNSAVALLRHLIARPKPRTLTAAIRQKGELEKLGNVTIHAKRRTIFEKEKDIGRLNAIEKELASRGLEPLEKKTRSFSKQVDSS
jgi:HD-like signal output (HDOD) protein